MKELRSWPKRAIDSPADWRKSPERLTPPKAAGNGKTPDKPGKGGGGGGGGGDRQRRPSARKKIGQVLIDLGFINEDQLWHVLDHHQQTGELTGQAPSACSSSPKNNSRSPWPNSRA